MATFGSDSGSNRSSANPKSEEKRATTGEVEGSADEEEEDTTVETEARVN